MSDPRVRAAARGLVGNASRISPRKMVRRFALVFIGALASFSSLHAQTGTPVAAQQPPKAIYTPKPVYRPEWAKQGLAGKGVVLMTDGQRAGQVVGTGKRQGTGNQPICGASL